MKIVAIYSDFIYNDPGGDVMPLMFIRSDITALGKHVDAIVNTANPMPTIGGGTDAAIYASAGSEKLLRERRKIGSIEPGDAKATNGFDLCQIIIHTVGPNWKDGKSGELDVLRRCYRNSLKTAKEENIGSVAFPLISSGVYGISKEDAIAVAISEIMEFLLRERCNMDVFLCVFDSQSVMALERAFPVQKELISNEESDDVLRSEYASYYDKVIRRTKDGILRGRSDDKDANDSLHAASLAMSNDPASFKDMINRYLDLLDMKPKDLYASEEISISRQRYSKMANGEYRPSKWLLLKMCLKLKLNLTQIIDLYSRVGYAFNPSEKEDVVIYSELSAGNYDLNKINLALKKSGCGRI